MKTLTVRLDQQAFENVSREARAEGVSISVLVRRRLQGIDPLDTPNCHELREYMDTVSTQLAVIQSKLSEMVEAD
jgi:hypothetical protein